MAEKFSQIVPHFIRASSLIGLQQKCLEANLAKGGMLQFYAIQFVNDGKEKFWIAFYNDEIDELTLKQLTTPRIK